VLTRIADWTGAHRVAGWESYESERARQRFVVCLVIAVIDMSNVSGSGQGLSPWIFLAGSAYGLVSLWYSQSLRQPRPAHVKALYVFLIADPVALLLAIASAPETFVFLVPLVLIANIGPGMRYGSRALNLTLALSALTVTGMFALGDFWRRELQWSAALVLALLLVPIFFRTQIRRIHDVRRIEEERAALNAKSAAVLDRAVFLSKVSHELRSPLQSMVSSLDVFEMRHLDAARGDAELISRMRRASLLLNTQLRDLLTLAKGEAGRLELRPETFEAGALVHAMADAARPLAEARGLVLAVQVPEEPTFVVADASRIDQILTNLVSNSVRYTDVGSVHVVLHPFEAALGRLRVSVTDTGRGIPESELPTVFLPDRQGATTARRGEGSGIGLAIVRILVDHLGGKISVTSRLGEGTTFDVEIPAAQPASQLDPAADSRADQESQTGSAEVQGLPTRVLVVDDRADVLDAIAGVIDEIGYLCDRAASAGEAANLLASRRYALALVDLEMPGQDGTAIAWEIRRGGGPNADIRIVAITAGDPPRSAGIDPGATPFDGWLAKPVDSHALRRAVLGADRDSRPSQPGLFADTVVPSAKVRPPRRGGASGKP
jgi:signal transduction histidine kinase/ActR/RegA family two-component response regulator